MSCFSMKFPTPEPSSGSRVAPGNALKPTTSKVPKSCPPAPVGHSQAKRFPTDSSYYNFHPRSSDCNEPDAPIWMYAREARSQVAGLGSVEMAHIGYPKRHINVNKLTLSTPGSQLYPTDFDKKHLEHPLKPGTRTTWVNGSGHPGAVRAVYTKGNPKDFDVLYHDRLAGVTKSNASHFSPAEYVPKAKK